MSWFLAFAGFAMLVILHEFGHFIAAKSVGMRVERFSLFFPPKIFGKKIGETEYMIGAIPAGGYVKITGMNPEEEVPPEHEHRAYYKQAIWKRIVVIAAGPAMNLLLAFILLFVFFALIGRETTSQDVGAIEKGYPAAAVLESGDEIVSVDGEKGDFAVLGRQIATHKCDGRPRDGCKAATPAKVTFVRDGRLQTVSIRPIYDARPGIERMRLGFGYAAGPRETLALGDSFTESADQFWFITKETAALPVRLFDAEDRKEVSGIVGSYEVTRQTILDNVADVVGILAIISLSLAIVNLFPFLPLDGGHIFWALVEKVRGRPPTLETMERASIVGFMLVIGIFMLGLTNDIDRLQNEGFGVR